MARKIWLWELWHSDANLEVATSAGIASRKDKAESDAGKKMQALTKMGLGCDWILRVSPVSQISVKVKKRR